MISIIKILIPLCNADFWLWRMVYPCYIYETGFVLKQREFFSQWKRCSGACFGANFPLILQAVAKDRKTFSKNNWSPTAQRCVCTPSVTWISSEWVLQYKTFTVSCLSCRLICRPTQILYLYRVKSSYKGTNATEFFSVARRLRVYRYLSLGCSGLRMFGTAKVFKGRFSLCLTFWVQMYTVPVLDPLRAGAIHPLQGLWPLGLGRPSDAWIYSQD
jgi:hypothetical protein